jgi:hypothetical protein
MPIKTTTIIYNFKEIQKLIETDCNLSLKVVNVEISETGDHDRGTYKQEIKNITFEKL